MIRTAITIGITLTLLAGTACRRDSGNNKDATPSSLQTVADGVTGRTALRAGQKARDDIERITAQRDSDLDAVLGD